MQAALDQEEREEAPDPPPAAPLRLHVRSSLRGKTIAIIAITLLGLLVVVYIPLRLILFASFIDLEEQNTRQNVQRAVNALADNVATLDRTAADYGAWDDTYAFIQSVDATYIASNMLDTMFISNRLNLVMFIDSEGRTVFSKAFDQQAQRERPLPAPLREPSPERDRLLRHADETSSITGILLFPEGPMLIASRPILTSAHTGPIRGTLIMGRDLDAEEVRHLAETTRQQLDIRRLDAPELAAEFAMVRDQFSNPSVILTRPLSDNEIAGYALLEDLFEQPALLLRVTAARQIHQQGRASVLYFTMALLAAGLIFGVVMLVLLERAVLSRLVSLNAEVSRIGTLADLSARVTPKGRDELTALALTINRMLLELERVQAERARVEEERARLQEEVVRSKEQLAQMIVHDLKNPLTAIMGFLDILRMTSLSAEQTELVAMARQSSRGMLHLITTILDTARLEEGKLELRRELTDVAGLVRSCADELSVWARQEQHPLQLELADALPPIELDTSLMRRVMLNLLSNAIKHTPAGAIITLGATYDDGALQLWVRDNGPGIPAERLADLFQRFSATSNGGGGRQASTGLGLTFCRLAVEAHGGTIAVESGPNCGTMFRVVLPVNYEL